MLTFNIKIILGLMIFSVLSYSYEKNNYHSAIYNKSHHQVAKRKVIYNAADHIGKCSKLLTIEYNNDTSISDFINFLQQKCKFLISKDKSAANLMQTTTVIGKIEKKTLTDIFDMLFNPYGMRYTFEDYWLKISAMTPSKKIDGAKTVEVSKAIQDNIWLPAKSKTKHPAPQIYSSLGNQLNPPYESCQLYKKSKIIDKNLIKICNSYSKKVAKAFKIGYKLDAHAYGKKTRESKKEKFLKIMLEADEVREKLVPLIHLTVREARTSNDIDQYIQLIEGGYLGLTMEDYKFMDKHPEKMKNNESYVQYKALIKEHALEVKKRAEALALEKKRQTDIAKAKKEKERQERHAKMLKKAQEDLRRQIQEAKKAKEQRKAEQKREEEERQAEETRKEEEKRAEEKREKEERIFGAKLLNKAQEDLRKQGRSKTSDLNRRAPFKVKSIGDDGITLMLTSLLDDLIIMDIVINDGYAEYKGPALPVQLSYGQSIYPMGGGRKFIKVKVITNKGSWTMSPQDIDSPIMISDDGHIIISTVPKLIIKNIIINNGHCRANRYQFNLIHYVDLPKELNTGEQLFYSTSSCYVLEVEIVTNRGSWKVTR